VAQVRVPCWPELAPKKIWAQAMLLTDFPTFMPDQWGPDSKLLERPFFYGVLCTLAPWFVTMLVKDCRDQRAALAEQALAQKPLKDVQIDDAWLKRLLNEPFASGKYFFVSSPSPF